MEATNHIPFIHDLMSNKPPREIQEAERNYYRYLLVVAKIAKRLDQERAEKEGTQWIQIDERWYEILTRSFEKSISSISDTLEEPAPGFQSFRKKRTQGKVRGFLPF